MNMQRHADCATVLSKLYLLFNDYSTKRIYKLSTSGVQRWYIHFPSLPCLDVLQVLSRMSVVQVNVFPLYIPIEPFSMVKHVADVDDEL